MVTEELLRILSSFLEVYWFEKIYCGDWIFELMSFEKVYLDSLKVVRGKFHRLFLSNKFVEFYSFFLENDLSQNVLVWLLRNC